MIEISHKRTSKAYWPVFALSILMIGCGGLSCEEFITFFENTLTIRMSKQGSTVTLAYRNKDFARANALRVSRGPEKKPDGQAIGRYDKYHYLVLRIEGESLDSEFGNVDPLKTWLSKGRREYTDRWAILTHGCKEAAKIVLAAGDTLHPLSYHLDRSWGIGNATTFTFVFPYERGGEKLDLNRSKAVIGSLGWIPINLELTIPAIPELKGNQYALR